MLNRSRTMAALALLATVAVACEKKDAGTAGDTGAAAAATTFDKSAEVAAILAQGARWERGVSSGNIDSVMAIYADDAISMSDGMPAAKGKAAVSEAYANFLKAKPRDIKLTSSDANFSDDGTVAYEHGSFSGTLDGPNGKPMKMAGDYLAVWKKFGGEWKIVEEISNSTIPRA